MKYVVLQVEEDGYTRIYPVIFCDQLVHVSMVAATAVVLKRDSNQLATILTAGHCWMDNDKWECQHGSESLKLPKDASLDSMDADMLNYPEVMNGIIHHA